MNSFYVKNPHWKRHRILPLTHTAIFGLMCGKKLRLMWTGELQTIWSFTQQHLLAQYHDQLHTLNCA